jgi:transposase-like protein
MRCCPHCGCGRLGRWGRTARGVQRWHCRDCGRKHQATDGTPLAGLHAPEKFHAMVIDMLGERPSSCRRLATQLATDKSTIWAWRQKACRGFGRKTGQTLPAPARTSLVMVRESRKASREWVNHARAPQCFPAPDRLRWIDYRRLGLPPPDRLPRYRIPVQIEVDDTGPPRARVLAGPLRPEATWATRALPAVHSEPAAGSRRGHDPAGASRVAVRRPVATAGSAGASLAASADAACRRFRDFLRPFRGPATRHLPAYVAWFAARHAVSRPAPAA